MKTVFFGTPKYCIPVLNLINKNLTKKIGYSPIIAVVTQEPKPVGRKKFVTYSPVDTWAYKRKIPVFHSADEIIENKIEADVGILAAYGKILSKEIVTYFPYGILNIHPSLLPKYRGASPLQAVIAANEKISGGTIIKLDEKMDHGPIVAQFEEGVLKDDNYETLGNRIFEKSGQILVELLPSYLKNKIELKEQDHKKATFTTLLKKDHGFIPPQYLKSALQGTDTHKDKWQIAFIKDFRLKANALNIERFIRAVFPWPGAWTLIHSSSSKEVKRLKILKAHIENKKLILDKVQLEGKTEVSWKEFSEGYPNFSFSSK